MILGSFIPPKIVGACKFPGLRVVRRHIDADVLAHSVDGSVLSCQQ